MAALRCWASVLVVAAVTVTLGGCGGQGSVGRSAPSPVAASAVRWQQVAAPKGIDIPGAEWLEIDGAGGRRDSVQTAAVMRPQGSGPYPLVVWLHGGRGFHVGDVTQAARLTAYGLMVMVGCWQYTSGKPDLYGGQSFPTVPCLEVNTAADSAVDALIAVAEQLPDARNGAIGIFGISSSGPVALGSAVTNPVIRVVVVDSTGQGPSPVPVPVLMLGGTDDLQIPIEYQQSYEKTLRDSGTVVESHYYEGDGHGVTYFGPYVDDALRRTADFFNRYIGT